VSTGLNDSTLLSQGQSLEYFRDFKPKVASDQALADSIKAWRIVAFIDDSEGEKGEPYRKLFKEKKAKNEKDVADGKTNVSLLNDEQLKMAVINSLLTKFVIPENAVVNPLPGVAQKFYVENTPLANSGWDDEADSGVTTTWTPYGVPYQVTSQTGEMLEYRIWIILFSDAAEWMDTLPDNSPDSTDGNVGLGWGWEYN
jgi:hypothetical protein